MFSDWSCTVHKRTYCGKYLIVTLLSLFKTLCSARIVIVKDNNIGVDDMVQ